jgi:hypothetical protein
MAEPISPTRIVYRKKDNDGDDKPTTIPMYAIDAHNAVTNYPDQYSYQPFDGSEGVNLPNGDMRPAIPNDWVDLKPSERIALARTLGGKDIRSGADADKFINDYLVSRANAGATEAQAEPKKDEGKTDETKPAA